MSAYKELMAQKAELDRQIEAARRAEVATAVQMIHDLMAEFNLTEEEVFSNRRGGGSGEVKEKKVVPVKYRNSATGETWTGRGKAPRWLDGKNRDDFLIE